MKKLSRNAGGHGARRRILANAQAVEHYEMARYGTVIAWAKTCGADPVAELMHETLQEEKKADATWTGLRRRASTRRR